MNNPEFLRVLHSVGIKIVVAKFVAPQSAESRANHRGLHIVRTAHWQEVYTFINA